MTAVPSPAAAMPALPPALAPWAALFADVPPPQARLVATLVDALTPLIERAAGTGARPLGAIDSLAGLGTAGGIERLVASEWLLRDLAPDEFLRRAAERELLTFQPVHRQEAQVGALFAVLDAGPRLIGPVRLVVLAALLCLGGAARHRGARLLWASNAFAAPQWREGVAAADAAVLLKEVADTPLDDDLLDRLAAMPAAACLRRAGGGSLWLVGSPALPDAARAHRVAIDERPRLDAGAFASAARVAVTDPRGGAAGLVLDLPGEAEAVGLLRHPFQPRRPPPESSAAPTAEQPSWVEKGAAFAPGAACLLLALRGGVLLVPPRGDARRLAFAGFERPVGLHATADRLWAAHVIKYSEQARLIVRSFDLARPGEPARQHLALPLPFDHPLARARFDGPALPPLGVLKGRGRFWLHAADGQSFRVAARVTPYSAVKPGRVLAVCPGAVLVRRPDGTVVAHARADGHVLAKFPGADAPPERIRSIEAFPRIRIPALVTRLDDDTWSLDPPVGREQPMGRDVAPPEGRFVGFLPTESLAAGGAGGLAGVCHVALPGDPPLLAVMDADGSPLGDALELPHPSLDAIRLAAHPQHGACIAALALDREGFPMAFALHTAGTGWRDVPDVAAFAHGVPCLGA